VGIPFRTELEFEYGVAAAISPMVRRVVARNPSAFTFHGTGTYIVGHGRVAIIDPGPALADHIEAVLDAVRGEEVSHILITHTHIDHSPATPALKAATGARVYGFGPHGTRPGGPRVEEGADYDFAPDETIGDGDVVAGAGWTFEAVHTPGHTSNHLCFALEEERTLFTGDHVMGWSTSVISPPDGDMTAYMASLRKLLGRDDALYRPTHGTHIDAPRPFVEAFISHREDRERQIARCLDGGIGEIPRMVDVMYADVDPRLHRAAARSVLAHLMHMVAEGRAACDGEPDADKTYRKPGH